MYFDQNMIIDATRGSIARFVNHSCEPNCRMEKWTVAGKPRMALFAGENGIMTGDELSYDYNFEYVPFDCTANVALTPCSPYSNKNVQQCRCGSKNCRGILGPRPKDKEQRLKGVDEKKAVGGPKTTKKTAGTKRKLGEESGSTASHQGKKRKLLAPKSLKAGVKKAFSTASTARGKATAKKTASSPTGRGETAMKKGVKLPTVKGATKVKATVRGPRGKTRPAKDSAKPNQLKRPSAETKKQILAAAAKGSKGPSRKSPAKTKAQAQTKAPRKPVPKKSPTKSPVKAKTSAAKAKSSKTAASPAKAKAVKGNGLSGSVRSAARSVVRSVRGAKK